MAIPNKVINLTPAEMPNGIPRIYNVKTPITAANGMAEKTIMVSRIEVKVFVRHKAAEQTSCVSPQYRSG